MPKTIRQTVTFKGVTPHELYEWLMDSRKHARMTGGPAKIGRRVGGAWSAFDGGLSGTQVALVADRKIVQTWRDRDWTAGVESTATFTFTRVPGGAKVTLVHSGLPDDRAHEYRDGWRTYYWEPLKKILRERARA